MSTKQLTAKAEAAAPGQSYEAWIAAGWKDTTLIEHGYLELVFDPKIWTALAADGLRGAAGQPLRLLPATQAAHVLTFNNRSRYEATLPNLKMALSEQKLARLGFDTFLGKIMIAEAGTAEPQWQPLTDIDVVRLREAFERVGFASIGKEIMRDVLAQVADDYRFDSAIEWLQGLTWDGKPRVDRFMADYCGAEDSDYSRAVSRYMWSALAGRVHEPGCQLDMVIAMQSKQGTRKSSGFAALVPAREFFTDSVALVDDADNLSA